VNKCKPLGGGEDGTEVEDSVGGFSQHWFTGVSPAAGPKYWGTPHRIVLDYPKEMQSYLAGDLPKLCDGYDAAAAPAMAAGPHTLLQFSA
jgi:hypothetical protein